MYEVLHSCFVCLCNHFVTHLVVHLLLIIVIWCLFETVLCPCLFCVCLSSLYGCFVSLHICLVPLRGHFLSLCSNYSTFYSP